jgi:predicted CopG family antitoxin
MVTKTLTITEESYKMLLENKLENESFSQEIKRILGNRSKKELKDFFGIISKEDGNRMLFDLEKVREQNIREINSQKSNYQ